MKRQSLPLSLDTFPSSTAARLDAAVDGVAFAGTTQFPVEENEAL